MNEVSGLVGDGAGVHHLSILQLDWPKAVTVLLYHVILIESTRWTWTVVSIETLCPLWMRVPIDC
jgi:hypothetical protein